MAESARHSPALSGASVPAARLHQSAPQPLSRVGRSHRDRDRRPGRATRCAQSLQPGNRASLLQARIELARSESDRADDALARCTPATMRERLDVALLSARVAHVRKTDAADFLLAEALGVAKIEGFVVAVTDDWSNSDRASRCFSGQAASSIRAGRARSPRTQPDLPNRERQHSGPLSSRELTVVRYSRPDSRTGKSRRSSSFRTTHSRHTSSGSTKSSGFRLAWKR